MRHLVRRDVQSHQGHPFRRRYDGGDLFSRTHRTGIAAAALAPGRIVRRALRLRARYSRTRRVFDRIRVVCCRRVCADRPAHIVARRAGVCGSFRAAAHGSLFACLWDHDRDMAVGHLGAAQSAARDLRIHGLSLQDPNRSGRPRLLHVRRAALLRSNLRSHQAHARTARRRRPFARSCRPSARRGANGKCAAASE